ncbi:conserved hypothetical protein [Candidatus Magnetomoraceae bacterium gMMP-15]
MQSILLEIPEKIALHIKLPPNKAKKMLMEELVLRLYQQKIITSGQGASLLKMERLVFEKFLAENEILIHSDPEGLSSDLANLERIL